MATISVGASTRGRAVDHDLPLVPFIDFLLCLIAFLLVTAVWVQMSRLAANANVPGEPTIVPEEPAKMLHVQLGERDFDLTWKRGASILASRRIERKPQTLADGTVRFPDLEANLVEEWKSQGVHRAASDPARDRAVLHTRNSASFAEVAAVLDALHGPARRYAGPLGAAEIPAFSVSFATD